MGKEGGPNKSEFIGDYLSFGKRKEERRSLKVAWFWELNVTMATC